MGDESMDALDDRDDHGQPDNGRRLTHEQKFEAMVLWGRDGKSYDEIAELIGAHRNTIYRLRKLGEPQDWDAFREQVLRDRMEVAYHQIKTEMAAAIQEQWRDNRVTSAIIRALTRRIATELDPNSPNSGKSTTGELVAMTDRLSRALVRAQQHGNNLLGLPNLRVGRSTSDSPLGLIAGRRLEDLEDDELVRLVLSDFDQEQ